MNWRIPTLVITILLLGASLGCSGSGGGGGNDQGSTDTTTPDAGGEGRIVGPPMPEIVDETGVPRISDARRVAFTGVELVAMEDETIASGRTVLVEAGVVTTIGLGGSVSIPEGTELIDGRGRYLMPGLVDMHIHALVGADLSLIHI